MATFEIYKDGRGEYRWRLQAENNKITADSGEGYKTRQAVTEAIERIKKEVATAITDDKAPH